MSLDFYFSPFLPWWGIVSFFIVGFLATTTEILKKIRGGIPRLLTLILLAFLALGPKVNTESRLLKPDIVVVIVDKTKSQTVGRRAEIRDKALSSIVDNAKHFSTLELRIVTVENTHADGSYLLKALSESIKKIPRNQYSGAILLTDGQVHDTIAADKLPGPIHVLLTGEPGEYDRRLEILNAPNYGIVGDPVIIKYSIIEKRHSIKEKINKENSTAVPVEIRVDGKVVEHKKANIGRSYEFKFRPNHPGLNIVEIQAETVPEEISNKNNRNFIGIKAIRDRLQVLLISGKPHSGERTWRNLLKSDPSIDLIHFTILRPPEKDDFTPLNELALISFPVDELFGKKIDKFDLIIFDRYMVRDVLPPSYIRNINKKVQGGGALLLAVGPEFAGPRSLAKTPLSEVLPVMMTAKVHVGSFKPSITKIGHKHPITSQLSVDNTNLVWGSWFRQIEVIPNEGQILMKGIDELPLLIVSRVGNGRVGVLASDHIWLWSRGYEGGGPHDKLIKRLSHWLMQEPELEEERIKGRVEDKKLIIERHSLSREIITLKVTTPSGAVLESRQTPNVKGKLEFEIKTPERGVYRVDDGKNKVLIPVGELNPIELRDLTAGPAKLLSLVSNSGGSFHWLKHKDIMLRRVNSESKYFGEGWIGFPKRNAYVVGGIVENHLLLGIPLAALIFLFLGVSWWREGR